MSGVNTASFSNFCRCTLFKRAWLIPFLAAILFSFSLQAQNAQNKIDPLLSQLQSAKQDTNKVRLLLDISKTYPATQADERMLYAQQALELSEQLKYNWGIASAHTAIGRTYWIKGRYDEAKKHHLAALDIWKKLQDKSAIANVMGLLGQDYADAGDYYAAISTMEKALQLYTDLKEINNIAFAHSILSYIYGSMGKYAESTEHQYKFLEYAELNGDIYGANIARSNIATSLMLQKKYSEAISIYKNSIKLYEDAGDAYNLISTYNDLVKCYIQINNLDSAIYFQNISLDAAIELKNNSSIGDCYSSLASILTQQNKLEDALYNYNRALDAYIAHENKLYVATTYSEIGGILTKLKRYPQARAAFNNALKYNTELSSTKEYNKLYNGLMQLDSATGDWHAAFNHYKLYISTRDSMFNDENTKRITQTSMQYDFDKKEALAKVEQEQKDAIALAALERQKLIRNAFISGFAIVLIFAINFFYQRNKIKQGKKQSDTLLLNILPEEVAEELKAKGSAEAKLIDNVTVLFSDFKNFTQLSGALSPAELVGEINACFSAFDHITQKYGIEKIKTIGDAYMAAGGIPTPNTTHCEDVMNAAIEMRAFMEQRKTQRISENKFYFEARFGAHTGPVVAGIVGVKKFAYDIWGDTVNTAQRMESNSETGKINISESTYAQIHTKFICTSRGSIEIKGKGKAEMYFVEGRINQA